jgi:hypothetical protein
LSKKINLNKKKKATLTCLTIGYNLAGLVNAFLIPLMADFLSSLVTWRVVLSRQANLCGSSSSCTMKLKDRRTKLKQQKREDSMRSSLNSTSPIEENQGRSDNKN